MYAPGVSPPLQTPYQEDGATRSTRSWLKDVYPEIKRQAAAGNTDVPLPLECTQHAGQMVYVPEGWWHATVNVVETFGVARQLIPNAVEGGPVEDSAMFWRQAAEKAAEAGWAGLGNLTLFEGFERSLELIPTDADTLADLAAAHLRIGEFAEAEKAAERCIKAAPTVGRGPEVLLTIAVVLLQEVRQYDPDLFTKDSSMVQSWFKVGGRALRLLNALPIPHTVDNNGWVLKAFEELQENFRRIGGATE